ncbi:MAG: hypothetical protein ABEH43_03440, partial [Flavobacteriales bacterium]
MCPEDSVCFDFVFEDPNGDSVTLTSNVDSAIPGATITYSGNGNDSIKGRFCWKPTIEDTSLNSFTVKAEDDGCPILGSQFYTFDIFVDDGTYAGSDKIMCPSMSGVQLSASGGTTYSWSPSSSLSCSNCQNPVASPSST